MRTARLMGKVASTTAGRIACQAASRQATPLPVNAASMRWNPVIGVIGCVKETVRLIRPPSGNRSSERKERQLQQQREPEGRHGDPGDGDDPNAAIEGATEIGGG